MCTDILIPAFIFHKKKLYLTGGDTYMNLLSAISYATQKHDGQRRKVDDLPYIVHPYRVSMLLATSGFKQDIVTAGLLHDIVEDTDGTNEEIANLFGENVALLVRYASEPDKTLSWEERKKHTIETIKEAPIEAKVVVCADKIDNLTSILENEKEKGSQIWESFKRGKEDQKWYYNSIYESLIYGIRQEEHPNLFNDFYHLLIKLNQPS